MHWQLFMTKQLYLEGATPTRLGPRPLKSPRMPSFWMICLKRIKHSEKRITICTSKRGIIN